MAETIATHWGTPEGAMTRTGKAVTDAQLVAASAQLELVTGVIFDYASTLLGKRDLYWMTAAAEYQAAWLADQPDMHSRLDIEAASQDGQSVTLKPDALVLAPLARRALKRLSWRGSRTLSTMAAPGSAGGILPVGAPSYDTGKENWQPL